MIRTRYLAPDTGDAALRSAVAAKALAERLPVLAAEARRLASGVNHGLHGKRRSGTGENFWQFRSFSAGEPASSIDWRRSARDDKFFVREREWEVARTIWLWADCSQSMFYVSDLAAASKIDRALTLTLATAELLSAAGERVGLAGLTPPLASRRISERLIEAFAEAPVASTALPGLPLAPREEIVVVSDFLMPLAEIEEAIARLAARGARGHLVMVSDPVEESFPFDGQAVLHDEESRLSLRIGDAAAWRDDYVTRLTAFRAGFAQAAAARGWTMTVHRTDRPASEAMLRLATLLGATGAP